VSQKPPWAACSATSASARPSPCAPRWPGWDPTRHQIIYIANPAFGTRGLYVSIVRALGAEPGFHKAEVMAQAADLLAAEEAEGHRRVVVVIDEAHLMTPAQLEDLRLLTNSYRLDFAQATKALNAIDSAPERLVAYARLFSEVAAQGRMWLCGMSAAEWSSIGDTGQDEVTAFLSEQRTWLTATLCDGLKQKVFPDDLKPEPLAEVMLVALEGALLLAPGWRPDFRRHHNHETPAANDHSSPALQVKVSRR
jgi:hypothetical protein